MTTRGIRRKKSSLMDVKVAVIGYPGVGKSALAVRFLTNRYIGEYDHDTENRHKYEAMVDNEPVLFEIWDTCIKSNEDDIVNVFNLSDILNWADGILLVYSITDRKSFNFIRKAKLELGTEISLALLGNKVDMVHLRQVSTEEGEILAKDFDCKFSEVSAAEHIQQVTDAFYDLCREVIAAKRKSKKNLLDRIMLGGSRAYNRGKSDSALPKD